MALSGGKILIANRGEIALRLIRTVHEIGLKSVAVFTDDDASAPHVRVATEAYFLGTENASYANYQLLVAIAVECGATAVLPGYGFVSENAKAALAFEKAGVIWIGPSPEQIQKFGSKTQARKLAKKVGVPTVPGSGILSEVDAAVRFADLIGYPVLVKAVAGGGGMGQAVAYSNKEMEEAYRSVQGQAELLFGGGGLFIEKFIENARHVEVQVFGRGNGDINILGLRDCSVQRRRQKVIEEGPPANLDPKLSKSMTDSSVLLCGSQNYRSAGTVEFVVDIDDCKFYFLEVNTRLQVEHGVTELTTGIDIVRWMVEHALGKNVPKTSSQETGVAIQARIYAENPANDFLPSSGILSAMEWPEAPTKQNNVTVRVDSWATRGTKVTTNYDPLLGKILVHAASRAQAIAVLKQQLIKTQVRGVCANVDAVHQVLENESFASGMYNTKIMDNMKFDNNVVEVISPGLQSSLQDYPGRVGYWSIGVSPSGPMDANAMNIANALVGNTLNSTALEMTVKGCTIKFHTDSLIALTGARFDGEYNDGHPVPWWTPFQVLSGTVLELGTVTRGTERENEEDEGEDARFKKRPGGKIGYLAIRGGFDTPKYLGSSATFPVAKFGGEHGRFLRSGDFLSLKDKAAAEQNCDRGWQTNETLFENLIPKYNSSQSVVGALNGPHGSEDFFESNSLKQMWSEDYKVHHAANRLGVRLQGPSPKWTRADGGSAGLHPSNLHDYTYAPGAVNYSGNTPIVLMNDGPSLGGFVCPITVCTAEMWKIAQATPGGFVRFREIGYDDAREALLSIRKLWEIIRTGKVNEAANMNNGYNSSWVTSKPENINNKAIIKTLQPDKERNIEFKVVYRMSGDEHVLVEYGDIELDLAYRLRVHTLMEALKFQPWVKELCPGVRSLLIRYDADVLHVHQLVSELCKLEKGALPSVYSLVVPSRIVKIPLAFDCKWTKDALKRYQNSVRPQAPYLPSNVEFARRMNGLQTLNDVRDIMISAEYCVMGLGDVYLGAPCAVPLDPRHRIVTTKMAPARLFTHEGTVGIGGSYMCIYGMDSPGGYQLMGRTIPIWDTYGSVPESHRGAPPERPWLLEFFDRVKFYLVSDEELERLRSKYKLGELTLEIQNGSFSYANHKTFLEENKRSIAAFRQMQKKAFSEERTRWEEQGEADEDASAKHSETQIANGKIEEEIQLPLYAIKVRSGVAATVFDILVEEGAFVNHGESLVVMESMKVELRVEAPVSGIVLRIDVTKGDVTNPETALCVIQSSKEFAFGDMTVAHLRSMYKVGVLKLKSAISAIMNQCSNSSGLKLVGEEDIEKDLKVVQKFIGRRYLPLLGIPFVSVGNENDESTKLEKVLQSIGAVYIGKTLSIETAAQVILQNKTCFAIVMSEDNIAPINTVLTRVTHGLSIFTRDGSDAPTISKALGEASRI